MILSSMIISYWNAKHPRLHVSSTGKSFEKAFSQVLFRKVVEGVRPYTPFKMCYDSPSNSTEQPRPIDKYKTKVQRSGDVFANTMMMDRLVSVTAWEPVTIIQGQVLLILSI